MVDEHEMPIGSTRNNKENIPPNDISRPGRVFGQELGNIPKQLNVNSKVNTKNPLMRRSLTQDVIVQKHQIVDVKKPVLVDRTNPSHIIDERDEMNYAIRANLCDPTSSKMDIELNMELDKFDLENKHNPQVVSTVAKQIFQYLKGIECDYIAKFDYMSAQNDINEKMRAILIDWLVDVNVKFKLVPECLYMTVNLIDRFLTIKQVTRQKLQLVGVASLLIACKYEEIYPPALKEFVTICDHAYTTNQILEQEADILISLDFRLTHTSALKFLDRYVLIAGLDPKAQMFAKYLIETTLLESSMLKYKNSLLAAGAVFLVNKIFKKHGWTNILQHHTEFSEADVKPCAKDLYFTMQNSEKLVLHSVKRKFSSSKYMEVSKYRIEKVPSSTNSRG